MVVVSLPNKEIVMEVVGMTTTLKVLGIILLSVWIVYLCKEGD